MRVLFLLALALLTACSSTPPARFHTLPVAREAGTRIADGTIPGLRVGPFGFPDYLRRPNIVSRAGATGIELAEYERWAGSLEGEFHRLLGDRLGQHLGQVDVIVYPAPVPAGPTYQVSGSVATLDGSLGGDIVLDVRWTITPPADGARVVSGRSVIVEAVGGEAYADLVAAHARAIENLAAVVAAELGKLP